MVKGVADAVTSAVTAKLSIWDKLFGTQDKNVGYTSVLLAGQDQLQVGEGTGVPNITSDPPSAYSQCSFPGGNVFVVQPTVDPCAEQAAAVQAALATLQSLTDQLHNLQMQLQHADRLERQALQMDINDILKNQLPPPRPPCSRRKRPSNYAVLSGSANWQVASAMFEYEHVHG